jgi:hypothetical protein
VRFGRWRRVHCTVDDKSEIPAATEAPFPHSLHSIQQGLSYDYAKAIIMSSLTYTEKAKLEKLFGMSTGYVANFNDTTFGYFFADIGIDIHLQKYSPPAPQKRKNFGSFGTSRPIFWSEKR